MRILARAALAFSAAIFAANYLLPLSWLMYAAVFLLALSAGLLLLHRKWLRGVSICLLFFWAWPCLLSMELVADPCQSGGL